MFGITKVLKPKHPETSLQVFKLFNSTLNRFRSNLQRSWGPTPCCGYIFSPQFPTPWEVEAMAFRRSLELGAQLCFSNMVFEIVNSWNKHLNNRNSYFDGFLSDCFRMIHSNHSFTIFWVMRCCDKVAHGLVELSFFSYDSVWL